MAWQATGKLLSGLVVGAAVGATVAIVLSSRTAVVVPRSGGEAHGPTPFEPANAVIARARMVVEEVRSQFRQAIDEGRATSARTRAELNARFEEAKRGAADRQKT
jgi:gas vesicle protein